MFLRDYSVYLTSFADVTMSSEDMFGDDDDMDLVAAAEDGVEVQGAEATPLETLPG